jgi:integrase
MAKTVKRRRTRGNAWYWRQTDSWYFTPPGTKRRVRLKDERGNPIRGEQNKHDADLALARVKADGNWRPAADPTEKRELLVAEVCAEFIADIERRAASGTVVAGYRDEVVRYLIVFCEYCGALPVSQIKKNHIQHWIESHETWRSPATRRYAIGIVQAAFNYAEGLHSVRSPLQGIKKPPQRPRLYSFSEQEEAEIYEATDEAYGNFLFAAIHTGLRPFCELAKLTASDVEETPRGMIWRVYASKTDKVRRIPVRSEVAELTRKLIDSRPDEDAVVFRNSQGNPWKKVTGVGRFLKIKRDLKWDKDPVKMGYSTYGCRHTFAHRMLAGYWNNGVGCSIEVLAELLGDTPAVAFAHYGREWGQSYQDPLWEAVGVPATKKSKNRSKSNRRGVRVAR